MGGAAPTQAPPARSLFWSTAGGAATALWTLRMSTLTELFADLEPIPQDEGPEPIVRIAYPEGFETVMDYFRRVLVNGACGPAMARQQPA
jgi:hypothetical protein